MRCAVLDSTILVSAFLTPKGPAAEVIVQAGKGAFLVHLCDEILEETQQVLLKRKHLRKRHHYSDQQAIEFCQGLRAGAHVESGLPDLGGVTRDPTDNVVVACALKAQAQYLVTRDNDLLSLQKYREVQITTPEEFLALLRK